MRSIPARTARAEPLANGAWRHPRRTAKDYARYPEFLTMREFEVAGRILVTTLLDQGFATPRVLDALYKMRWNIEVDFRTIKATL